MKAAINFISHLFTPKEENNFRAKALHINLLTYYLFFAVLLAFFFKEVNLKSGDILGFATDITVNKLFELTNQERIKNNLSQLAYSENLSKAADSKARDMFTKNYWAHYSPDGKTPWEFILTSGYQYEFAGENLAKNFLFSQGVVDAWMGSEGHRENLLRGDYTDVGLAVANGVLNGEQTTLVVQMFGKPLTSSVATNDASPQFAQQASNVALQTPTTVPVLQTKSSESFILAKNTEKPKINIFNLPINLNLVFLFYLLLALFLDFYFATKLNIIRVGGKNLAHFIFVSFVLIGIIFLSKGTIL